MVVGKIFKIVGALIEDVEAEIGKALEEADNPEIRLEIGIKILGISIDMWEKALEKLRKKMKPEKLKGLEDFIKMLHEDQEIAKKVKADLFPSKEE